MHSKEGMDNFQMKFIIYIYIYKMFLLNLSNNIYDFWCFVKMAINNQVENVIKIFYLFYLFNLIFY